jgi:opacity protein-like surface antigen
MKLTYLTSTALLALVTTLGVRAGSTNDMKDMKQVSPAMNPSDAGFYVAAEGGVNFSTNYGDRATTINGPGGGDVTPDNTHSSVGAVGGIKAGYNFQSFPVCSSFRLQPAVEVEGLYIGMDSKTQGGGGAGAYHDSTSWNNAAGFVNGILRFKLNDQGFWSKVVPYVGIGVGAEYLTSHTDLNFASGAHPGNVGDEDVAFAVQGLVGVDYNLTSHWALFTEYKFIDALGANLESNIGGGNQYNFHPDQVAQNLATVGVKYNF